MDISKMKLTPEMENLKKVAENESLSKSQRSEAQQELNFLLAAAMIGKQQNYDNINKSMETQKLGGIPLLGRAYVSKDTRSYGTKTIRTVIFVPTFKFSYIKSSDDVKVSVDKNSITLNPNDPSNSIVIHKDHELRISFFGNLRLTTTPELCRLSSFRVTRSRKYGRVYENFNASSIQIIDGSPEHYHWFYPVKEEFSGTGYNLVPFKENCIPPTSVIKDAISAAEEKLLGKTKPLVEQAASSVNSGEQTDSSPNNATEQPKASSTDQKTEQENTSEASNNEQGNTSTASNNGQVSGYDYDKKKEGKEPELNMKQKNAVQTTATINYIKANAPDAEILQFIKFGGRNVFVPLCSNDKKFDDKKGKNAKKVQIFNAEFEETTEKKYQTTDKESTYPFPVVNSTFVYQNALVKDGKENYIIRVKIPFKSFNLQRMFHIYNPELGAQLYTKLLKSSEMIVQGWVKVPQSIFMGLNKNSPQHIMGNRIYGLEIGVKDVFIDILKLIRTVGVEVSAEFAIKSCRNYFESWGIKEFDDEEDEDNKESMRIEVVMKELEKLDKNTPERFKYDYIQKIKKDINEGKIENLTEGVETVKLRNGKKQRFYLITNATFPPELMSAYVRCTEMFFYKKRERDELGRYTKESQKEIDFLSNQLKEFTKKFESSLDQSLKSQKPAMPGVSPAKVCAKHTEVIFSVPKYLDSYEKSVYDWTNVIKVNEDEDDEPSAAQPMEIEEAKEEKVLVKRDREEVKKEECEALGIPEAKKQDAGEKKEEKVLVKRDREEVEEEECVIPDIPKAKKQDTGEKKEEKVSDSFQDDDDMGLYEDEDDEEW